MERDNVKALNRWLAANPGHVHHVEDRRYLGWVHVVETAEGAEVARDADLGSLVDRLERLG
jgi:hypothetical protein